jgi:Bacterial PH domain
MRLTSPNERARPASIDKYLLPDETLAISVRRHPSMLIPAAATAVGGLLAAGAISAIILSDGYLLLIIWGLVAFLWVQSTWVSLNWSTEYLVVTQIRLLRISGVLSRTIIATPLAAIHDLSFHRSFSGRLFGYGTFIIEPAAEGLSVIDYVPYPEQLYLELCRLISLGSSDGEDESPPRIADDNSPRIEDENSPRIGGGNDD